MHLLQEILADDSAISWKEGARVPAISLRNVNFSYPSHEKTVLKNICLDVFNGEFIVITGPSGCGKSTLAAALGGYTPHVVEGDLTGEIRINGISTKMEDFASLAVQASVCQQDPDSQLCTLSVRDEVAFGPENLGLPAKEIIERVQTALTAVNARHLEARGILELSGGEKQRIAIASMLAMQSKVLIFDEPTASLDPDSANEVLSVIERLRRETNAAVVVIEHRLDRLVNSADRLIVMENGAITMDGEAEDIYERYKTMMAPLMAEPGSEFRKARRLVPAEAEALRVQDLRFSYEDHEILHGISFAARKGEFVGIIGPNGSGKSTFLRCLAGLCRSASGILSINGIDVQRARISEIARHVGFIFQNPNHQIFANTVWGELTFACRNFGILREETERSARETMGSYGISQYERSHPLMLSHGEKRRLNICSSLPHDPGILILDEPFIGQDMANASKIMENLLRLARNGKTLLMVSHDMDRIYDYCDRIVFFRDGRILADDIPARVMEAVRKMGAVNFLPREMRP